MKMFMDHDGDLWVGESADRLACASGEPRGGANTAMQAMADDSAYGMALTEASERYGPMTELIEKPTTRYILDNDDDGHWYLIAEADKEAFGRYVYEDGPEPASMVRLSGHPNNVSFALPLEFGKEIKERKGS